MKLSWPNLLLIVVACFLVGAGVSWYGFSRHNQSPVPVAQDLFSDRFFDRFYDDDFFSRSRDPFQEMDRFRDRMQQELDQFKGITRGQFDNNFEQWFGDHFGNSPASKIRMTEDAEYVYYTLDIGDAYSEKVTVNVEGNLVEITAELKSRSEQSDTDRVISSSRMETIQQKFPVPAGTDTASINVEQPQGSVVVRFTKLQH